METKKVSVIIPVYNVEKYLEECINSVLKQTYSNIEILLIDDGSKDKSGVICDRYEKKDKRIKVIHKENQGVSSARNLGIENATGDFITFMDPDDWAESNMIEKAVETMIKHDADIVQWNSYYNRKDGQTKRKEITPSIIERNNEEIELFQLDIISTIYEEKTNGVSVGPIRGVWGKLYKKDIIGNTRFTNKLYAFEDGLFNLYVLEKANKMVLFNEYLHHYRINETSVCNSYKSDWMQQNDTILEEVQKFITERSKKETFQKVYNSLACELFSSCLTRYIFHPKNEKYKKEKIKELKQCICAQKYQDIWHNVDFKYLNSKQKLVIWMAKKKQANIIYILYIIKQKIKK